MNVNNEEDGESYTIPQPLRDELTKALFKKLDQEWAGENEEKEPS